MRLIFMGTPDFAVPILEALYEKHTIAAVYTQPPRVAGRGHRKRPGPIHAYSDDLGIPVFTPSNLRKPEVQSVFLDHEADFAVVAAYGLILPQAIIDAPRLGCLNVHASLLPRWRGAAPIQRAIMAGDQETGVTIMQMDAGLDTGDILMKEIHPIADNTTAALLHDGLAPLGAKLILQTLESLAAGKVQATPQMNAGVTYANKIEKYEAAIAFDRPARDVLRHIHGLSPLPGAFIEIMGRRLKILTVTLADNYAGESAAEPGTILDDCLTIACTEGAVRPTIVQLSGKSPVDTNAFLRGFKLRPGTRLG